MSKLTPLQKSVAEKLNALIVEQNQWIEITNKEVQKGLIGCCTNGWNLRQNIQALNTGKLTLTALRDSFTENIGMPYEVYVEDNKKADKPTIESRLATIIKDLIRM